MPTESKKKKSSRDEKKLLHLMKKEPEDSKSLEHYVDDRIELIKQIFDSLKTKTIESIIPDFLQEKPIEEIQEICLEELLGISKKRLLSIINATKCPTDTESSDSGSDVEKIEEHISLEEISSDSNDELSKPKKKKKRESKKEPKKEPPSKSGAASTKSGEQNGENPEKQYSVLELLELQARARAIRSQLALEPVTKIELDDSDNDTNETLDKDKQNDKPSVEKPTKSSQTKVNQKEKTQTNQLEEQSKASAPRPVRLKRNFRQRQMEGYESDESNSVNDKDKNSTETITQPKTPEKEPDEEASPEKQKSPVKECDSTAVNDDDVVPIVAEPEVLCISSSDSENDEQATSSKVKKYINMPVVEKVVRPPTEDELFLLKIKEKSEAMRKAEAGVSKTTERQNDSNVDSQSKQPESEKQNELEMEDGEIVEEDEIVEISESPEPSEEQSINDSIDKEEVAKEAETKKPAASGNKLPKETKKNDDKSESSGSESDSNSGSSTSEDEDGGSDNSEKSKSQTSKKSAIDDDDEDIIDLGKDEDLDFEQLEMNATPEEPQQEETTRRTRSKTKSHKSDETETTAESKDESWDKRWLRGNKVSKVLATAKLANKVRSKMKEKKATSMEIPQKTEEIEPPKETVSEMPSNVEVGSVEHYNLTKELTKQK